MKHPKPATAGEQQPRTRKAGGIKAVKAWGVVTRTGRLRNYATRYYRQMNVDLNFDDEIIPVLITPITPLRPARRKGSK